MIRKHNTSYDVFQRRISYAQGGQLLASGAGRLLGLGAGSSVGAGYLDGKAQQLSSAVSGIVKETSHKLISPHVSKVFLTQIVFPWLFASLLYMTNINVSHKGIETLSNTMGWIGFSFILYQFSQVYSTQAIAQEKAVSFEDSLLMETLLKKLDAPKQAVARSGISEVLGTLEDQTLSTMRRVELGLSGSIKLASVVPGVPKSVHSVLYHTQQGLTSLELAFSIMQSSQAASASEDSDEEAPLLTAVVSSASMGSGAKASSERGPKLGFSFELGEALKGVYAQTSPAEILQSEPRFRL